MSSMHYHDALVFGGHVLLHHAVGDLTSAHLFLQLTNSLRPSLHLLTQLRRCVEIKYICNKRGIKRMQSKSQILSLRIIVIPHSSLILPEHCFPVAGCSPLWLSPDSSAVCRCSYCKLSDLSVPGHKRSHNIS